MDLPIEPNRSKLEDLKHDLPATSKVSVTFGQPVNSTSTFNSSTTALQVLQDRDLTGRVAIVTGANVGIGYETARSLALHGCTVLFACRNIPEANGAIAQIKSERETVNCETAYLDLASLKSVQEFADVVKRKYKKVDMLILNAGVFGLPFTKTNEGFETNFQVNHLSHFYLTLKLRPVLAGGSRVVVVSSESHRHANLKTNTISPETLSPDSNGYWDYRAYSNSKLCNVLFARRLAKRWQSEGINVFSLHPGNLIATKITRTWWFYQLLTALSRPFTKSLQQGASTTVYCATSPELAEVTGLYFNHCQVCEESASAKDDKLAEDLWSISVNMIDKDDRDLDV